SSSRLTSSRRSFLRSYSKKPPQGDGTFLEIFESTLELTDFHSCDTSTRCSCAASGRQQVFDHELQPPFAQILIAVEAIDQPDYAARQRREFIGVEEIKGDGIELPAALAQRLRGRQRELDAGELAVGLDDIGRAAQAQCTLAFLVEGAREHIERG